MTGRTTLFAWAPAVVLGVGALFVVGVDAQRTVALEQPLEAVVPNEMAGLVGADIEISAEEQRVAGMDDYLMRSYDPPAEADSTVEAGLPFSLYVGYYRQQTQGNTIHSPKNCLPGAGWEPLQSQAVAVAGPGGKPVSVNRYLLQHSKLGQQALVLYWYQGRGRVEWNEYVVKWDLLKDAALRKRTEEALVRIVIPLTGDITEAQALEYGVGLAADVIADVNRALPTI